MARYESIYTNEYIEKKDCGINYDNIISNKFESLIWEIEKKKLKEIVKSMNNSDLYLDFACGTGRVINFLSKKFENSIGLDTAENMLKFAKNKNSSSKFICGNIIEDKNLLNNQKFEIITSFRLFLNLESDNRKKILIELRKYLNDDGTLVINNHMNRYSILGLQFWMRSIFKPRSKRSNKNRIINTASEIEFRKLLENCGFKVEKVHRFMLLPGRKNFILLPSKLLIKIELILSKIPLLNLLSKDQIYVCVKK